jgi:hypothetical protein
MGEAGRFLNSLVERCNDLDIPFNVQGNIEDIVISENPKMVLISDYNHEGSGSPS